MQVLQRIGQYTQTLYEVTFTNGLKGILSSEGIDRWGNIKTRKKVGYRKCYYISMPEDMQDRE